VTTPRSTVTWTNDREQWRLLINTHRPKWLAAGTNGDDLYGQVISTSDKSSI